VGGQVYSGVVEEGEKSPNIKLAVYNSNKVNKFKKELQDLEDSMKGTKRENILAEPDTIKKVKGEYIDTNLEYSSEDGLVPEYNTRTRIHPWRPRDKIRINKTLEHTLEELEDFSFEIKELPKTRGVSPRGARGTCLTNIELATDKDQAITGSYITVYKCKAIPDKDEKHFGETLEGIVLMRLEPPEWVDEEHVGITDLENGEHVFWSNFTTDATGKLSRTEEIALHHIGVHCVFENYASDTLVETANVEGFIPIYKNLVDLYFDYYLADLKKADPTYAHRGIIGQVGRNGEIKLWESNPVSTAFRSSRTAISIGGGEREGSGCDEIESMLNNIYKNQPELMVGDNGYVIGMSAFILGAYSKIFDKNGLSETKKEKISDDLKNRLNMVHVAHGKPSFNSVISEIKKEQIIKESLDFITEKKLYKTIRS
jgi:hypothetical protein